jgi:FixJ family two-component response regulator
VSTSAGAGRPAIRREAVVVHVVDDDSAMRTALARLLSAAGYAPRCYASAGDFLIEAGDQPTGCLLLDLQMPGPDGLALLEALRRRGSAIPAVFLSGEGDIPSSVRALKTGASDFLTKPVQGPVLLAAIEAALKGAMPAGPAVVAAAGEVRALGLALTERERTVLRGVLDGALNKQMAAQLGVSERTVKYCRADLMRKLGARSLVDLVRLGGPLLAQAGPGG